MESLLVLILVALVIVVFVLVLQYYRAREALLNLQVLGRGFADEMFQEWREKEMGRIRSEEKAAATRDAGMRFEEWKLSSGKSIAKEAIQKSQSVIIGKVSEHLAPYLPDFPFNPKDVRFLGTPVDTVVFDGLSENNLQQIVFCEVKTAASSLTPRERAVRDAVKSLAVKWFEYHIPVQIDVAEENMDLPEPKTPSSNSEESEKRSVYCPHCNRKYSVTRKEGQKYRCPLCKELFFA